MVELDKKPALPNFLAGVVFGALFVLAAQRLFAPEPELPTIQKTPASSIVEAYRMGLTDAVKTNPPSWQLEEACLEVWANKQPTQ